MGNLVKISKQTIFQLLGKVITSVATFIMLGLIARNFGEDGTGTFTLALTYLSIFYLLSDFGFNAHILKQQDMQWQKLLGTRIVWSIILIGISLALLPFWSFATPSFSQSVLIGSLAIMGSAVFVTSNLIFQSKLRYDFSVLASSTGTLIGLAVFLYFISLGLPISVMVLPHMISWIIIALTSLILVKRLTSKLTPLYDFSSSLKLLKDSWPIAATLALNVVYFRVDSFLLAYFRNISDVGIYNIAFSIFQTALVFPAFIMNAYYPMMLKSLKQIRVIGLILLVIAGLGSLLTFLLAPLLVSILTGGGFEGSVESLQILSLGFPAFFLSSLMLWILVTKNRYKVMLAIYGIGLLVNIVLNLIYIPSGSFIAASWITVLCEYLILTLQVVSLIR